MAQRIKAFVEFKSAPTTIYELALDDIASIRLNFEAVHTTDQATGPAFDTQTYLVVEELDPPPTRLTTTDGDDQQQPRFETVVGHIETARSHNGSYSSLPNFEHNPPAAAELPASQPSTLPTPPATPPPTFSSWLEVPSRTIPPPSAPASSTNPVTTSRALLDLVKPALPLPVVILTRERFHQDLRTAINDLSKVLQIKKVAENADQARIEVLAYIIKALVQDAEHVLDVSCHCNNCHTENMVILEKMGRCLKGTTKEASVDGVEADIVGQHDGPLVSEAVGESEQKHGQTQRMTPTVNITSTETHAVKAPIPPQLPRWLHSTQSSNALQTPSPHTTPSRIVSGLSIAHVYLQPISSIIVRLVAITLIAGLTFSSSWLFCSMLGIRTHGFSTTFMDDFPACGRVGRMALGAFFRWHRNGDW